MPAALSDLVIMLCLHSRQSQHPQAEDPSTAAWAEKLAYYTGMAADFAAAKAEYAEVDCVLVDPGPLAAALQAEALAWGSAFSDAMLSTDEAVFQVMDSYIDRQLKDGK